MQLSSPGTTIPEEVAFFNCIFDHNYGAAIRGDAHEVDFVSCVFDGASSGGFDYLVSSGTVAWTDVSSGAVTPSADATDWRRNGSSAKFVVGASPHTGDIARINAPQGTDGHAVVATWVNHIGMWAKASSAISAGVLRIKAYSDVDGGGDLLATYALPAIGTSWAFVDGSITNVVGTVKSFVLTANSEIPAGLSFWLNDIGVSSSSTPLRDVILYQYKRPETTESSNR